MCSSGRPLGESFDIVMPFVDIYKRLKRLRLFEPSVGILGITVCLILCFFSLLDYRTLTKPVGFPWLKIDGVEESVEEFAISGEEKIDSVSGGGCDLFDGDWVWDESYPLYESRDCRFLDQGFRCSENGRPDSFYTKWRWQPKDCNLTRLDAKTMLEKMRNKRIVFAGDSIGRNQWESLLCILASAVPNKDSIYEVNGNPITKHKGFLVFKFMDYNCTVEYYRAPFLVLQSRPPAGAPRRIKTTLKLDQMDWMSKRWKDADLLILNTGHWWNYEKTVRGGCYYQQGSKVKMDMSDDNAYEAALGTVLDWIQRKVNTSKTHVVFRMYAPVHFRGGDWRSGGSCHLETLPDTNASERLVPPDTWTKLNIFNRVVSLRYNTSMSGVLDVLNITLMTARRKDAHSSLYYLGSGRGLAPLHRQDCSHWCLPGVPDAWNELLYALILRRDAIRPLDSSGFHTQLV